jgi:hypothetical protein
MNRNVLSLHRPLRLALGFAALTLALAGNAARASEPPAPAPPPEVAKLFDRLAGTWTAKEVTAQIGPDTLKGTSRVTCEKTAGGGISCRVQVNMGGKREEETNLFGWDPQGGRVHMFAVNGNYAHDHVGALDGQTLALEFTGTRDGKPFHEQLSFTLKGPGQLEWKDTCTLAGQVVFAGNGLYRK